MMSIEASHFLNKETSSVSRQWRNPPSPKEKGGLKFEVSRFSSGEAVAKRLMRSLGWHFNLTLSQQARA